MEITKIQFGDYTIDITEIAAISELYGEDANRFKCFVHLRGGEKITIFFKAEKDEWGPADGPHNHAFMNRTEFLLRDILKKWQTWK